jgi:hypothetical protein
VVLLGAVSSLVLAACGGGGGGRKKPGSVDPGVLFINEIVPNADKNAPAAGAVLKDDGGQPILDADGEAVDWIEVYNASPKGVQLRNVTLSIDPDQPIQYRFPKQVLAPGAFVVVICDGRPELGPLHAPFKLAAAGETVTLRTGNGKTELDRQTFRNLPANTSAGRYPDGEIDFGLIYAATPEAANKPINVKPPRVDGAAGLGPAGSADDDPTPLAVVVREDRELLNASVEILEVASCAEPGSGAYQGPFALQVIPELTVEVIEDRRNHLDEPLQTPTMQLTLFGLLPHFEAGDSLRLRFRLENLIGVTVEEQCQVVVGPEALLAFDPSAFVEPRCPDAGESADVFAFLRIASSSWSQEAPGAPVLEASLSYRAGALAAVTIDRDSGLVVEEAATCDRECYRPAAAERTTLLRIRGTIPAQTAGTLVTFSFAGRDLVRDEEAALAESAATATTSFRYLSGPGAPPPVVWNEVLPHSERLEELVGLYPLATRNDPAFETPDFAELYNSSGEPIDIGGSFLALGAPGRCSTGQDCPDGIVPRVRQFRIPDGAVMQPLEFWLFLFTSEAKRNTQPNFAGSGLEAKTTVLRDVFELDDCFGELHLMSPDAQGNCPVDRIAWDFRRAGSPACAAGDFQPDLSLGLLPDDYPPVRRLDVATPGRSNCIYAPPELLGEIASTVLGPAQLNDCLSSENRVRLRFSVLVGWREALLAPESFGLDAIEIVIERDGVAAAPRPIAEFPNTIQRRDGPETPICRAQVDVEVELPGPEAVETAATIAYRVGVVDTRGSRLDLGPVAYEICASSANFIRGDANGDGRINVTDLVWINYILFDVFRDPPCLDAADADDDGGLDPGDFLALADFIFRRGPRPPAPFPNPGPDPTADELTCSSGVSSP